MCVREFKHRVLIFALAAANMVLSAEPEMLEVRFESTERTLRISTPGLPAGDYELRIVTPGIREVETGQEVNEPGIIYLPPREGQISLTAPPPPPDPNTEIIFFFNDFIAAEGWELVLRFPGQTSEGARWKLNGRFSPLGGVTRSEISIPVHELERGENMLYFRAENFRAPEIFFRREIVAPQPAPTSLLVVGHSEWHGDIALLKAGAAGSATLVARVSVPRSAPPQRGIVTWGERWWEQREQVEQAVLAVGRNHLHAQVSDPGSLFHGGFNLVYDPQRKSHRIPHWIWAWGPSIALMFKLEKFSPAHAAALSERFGRAGVEAAERSLGFEVVDESHPARGISTVRWEPSRAVPGGWVEYMSTADSLFLAGWGWMSAYRATGRPVFLERTQSLVAAAERLMRAYPVVPQDWVVQRERWTPHTLDESVFGMIGFRELHAATRRPAVADIGRRFLDSHLEHMGRESGMLERAWLREEDRAIWDPDIKGHAWVVEGYLDAYQLSGDTKFLDLAHALARRVLECQHEDGSWTYLFKKAGPGDPRDDKGTAIWAYFLYELHRATKDPAFLAAGRRAVAWCLKHQYRGDDPHLDGGILNTNGMAYVRRRPMTILYSTAFFGLALLEELALQER